MKRTTSEPTTTSEGVVVLRALEGARVQRVDVPEPDLLALGMHQARVSWTLVLWLSDPAGIGVLDERPRGAPAGSVAQLFRKHLAGALLREVRAIAACTIDLRFERGGERAVVRAKLTRRNAGVALVVASGKVVGGLPRGVRSIDDTPVGPVDEGAWPRDLDELRAAGHARVSRQERTDDPELRRALTRARARVARRLQAIEGDLAAASTASRLRRDAALVLAAIGTLARGAIGLDGADPESGEPVHVALDPALSAAANAERLFVRARKLDRGASIGARRRDDARAEIAVYDDAIAALVRGDLTPARALVAAPPAPRERVSSRRVPFRTFALEDGSLVLVGRSSADNDALTFRHALPDDVFFHARARTGAHVILRSPPGRAPSDDAALAAAALAAHFSSLRDEPAADVMVATRRSIRRGRSPGSVIAPESTTLRVALATYPLAALLTRER